MSKKRVLDVGQCNADHSAISRLLTGSFDVELDRAHGRSDALDLMADGGYDLVLVNRLMDADGSSGLEIIKHIRSDEAFVDVPVMLVSNLARQRLSHIRRCFRQSGTLVIGRSCFSVIASRPRSVGGKNSGSGTGFRQSTTARRRRR